MKNTREQAAGDQRPGVAYLINKYPAISHTFILREVQGLRALGMRVETISINTADRPFAELTPEEQDEAKRTFLFKNKKAYPGYVLILLRLLFTRPGLYVRGFRAWSKYGGWDVRIRILSLFYLAEALIIGDWMEKRGLHHLHSHFGGAVAVVGKYMAAAFKKTYSFTIHGPDEYMDLRYLRVKQKTETAKFVVTVSEYGRAHLLRVLGMAARDHITAVHLGVSLKEFQPIQRLTKRPGEPVHLICVGRLVKEKAQDVLLEAMATLVRRGLNVRLTLVGDGTMSSQFKELAHTLELDDYVTFTGALPLPQTQALLRTADIFVLPSFAEGIPVALMEAMAMEIPCISTAITGIPELIEHGEDGVLVPPGNVDALASAIQILVVDPEKREELGKAGRVKVAREFNLEINVPKLHSVFTRNLALNSHPVATPVALTSENKVPAA